jgi:hypothetical protein
VGKVTLKSNDDETLALSDTQGSVQTLTTLRLFIYHLPEIRASFVDEKSDMDHEGCARIHGQVKGNNYHSRKNS